MSYLQQMPKCTDSELRGAMKESAQRSYQIKVEYCKQFNKEWRRKYGNDGTQDIKPEDI
jgi:hypothetical protein